jgi:phasin family protein
LGNRGIDRNNSDRNHPFTEASMAASRDFYDKAATVAHQTSKVLADLTDTAWGSAKNLNEKVMQNIKTNVDATFAAASEIASARSLPEIARIQTDYVQKLRAQATDQTKEFVDLSTRATQHVLEKLQAAMANSFKPSA